MVMKHIMAILISVFSLGYYGKTIDFEKYSPCHRTTVAHFLNKGKCYYVYRYEGNINGIDNAVVLISYPKDAFLVPKALRAFISTDASLSTHEVLDKYVER